MTQLQQMVYMDSLKRLNNERVLRTTPLPSLQELTIPSDSEIKENGYEGAVEQVYQQMVQLGQPA
jgi:hypothetical protein